MGLLQNGYRHNLTSRLIGATNLAGWNPTGGVYNGHRTAAMRNQFAGPAITDDLAAVPAGARPPVAWIMPRKAGGLSAHNEARGSAAATLAMASGINVAGTAAGAAITVAGTLQLVVSMLGTSAGAALAEGNIRAALLLAGIASGQGSQAATIGALAWAFFSLLTGLATSVIMLGIARTEPCLVVVRRTVGQDVPITLARLVHPGSRYLLQGEFKP